MAIVAHRCLTLQVQHRLEQLVCDANALRVAQMHWRRHSPCPQPTQSVLEQAVLQRKGDPCGLLQPWPQEASSCECSSIWL